MFAADPDPRLFYITILIMCYALRAVSSSCPHECVDSGTANGGRMIARSDII